MKLSEIDFLVAISDPRKADLFKIALENLEAHSVTFTENGLTTLKRIERNQKYFIIAEWNLPQLSGPKLLQEVRKTRAYAAMPFILVLSGQNQEQLMKISSLKATGFLAKSSTVDDIQGGLAAILGLETDPNSPEAMMRDADKLIDSGSIEEAIAGLDKAVETSGGRLSSLMTDMGEVLHENGRHEEARQNLKEAVELTPDSARSQSLLGAAALSSGHPEEAETALKKALELEPDNNDTKIGLADAYLKLNKDDEAEALFKEVLSFRTSDIYVYNQLGIAFRKQGKLKESASNYHKALKITTQDENLFFNLGRVYLEMKDREKAKKCMQKSLQLNPDLTQAKDILEAL